MTPHATPADLRGRAKSHMQNWRAWWRVDPQAARDELDRANDLLRLAEEAEDFGRMAA